MFAASLASIVGPRGPAQFRNTLILTEPSAWFLHFAMLAIFVTLVGSVAQAIGARAGRAQLIALGVVIVALTLAGVAAVLRGGGVWGFPLADAVWIFDAAVLVEQLTAFALAIALGTPGCEIGVWAELIGRLRGGSSPTTQGLACFVGLQLIDRWEAERRSRRDR